MIHPQYQTNNKINKSEQKTDGQNYCGMSTPQINIYEQRDKACLQPHLVTIVC